MFTAKIGRFGGVLLALVVCAEAMFLSAQGHSHSLPKISSSLNLRKIDWPTVLKVLHAPDPQVRLAEEKIKQQRTELFYARSKWWPDFRVGGIWRHHEGRIQDPDGTVFKASQSALGVGWLASLHLDPATVAKGILEARQELAGQQASYHRTRQERLRDGSRAYFKLVAAQAAELLTTAMLMEVNALLVRGQELNKLDLVSEQQLLQLRLERSGLERIVVETKQKRVSAAIDLAAKLGTPVCVYLFACESTPWLITLVDPKITDQQIVARVCSHAAHLREIDARAHIIATETPNVERLALMPHVAVGIGEGLFGGGPGSHYSDWGGRSTVTAGVYWNLTDLLRAQHSSKYASAPRTQLALKRAEVAQKLTAGALVLQQQIRAACRRVPSHLNEIQLATDLYNKMRENFERGDVGPTELTTTIKTLLQTRTDYLTTIVDHNDAQIQLHYLMGLPSFHMNRTPTRFHPRTPAPTPGVQQLPAPQPHIPPTTSQTGAEAKHRVLQCRLGFAAEPPRCKTSPWPTPTMCRTPQLLPIPTPSLSTPDLGIQPCAYDVPRYQRP